VLNEQVRRCICGPAFERRDDRFVLEARALQVGHAARVMAVEQLRTGALHGQQAQQPYIAARLRQRDMKGAIEIVLA
jgi:hypothetical protein